MTASIPSHPQASPDPSVSAALTSTQQAVLDRSIETGGHTLREHTARGTIINAGFLVALTTLGLVKGFVVAAFLSRSDYGIWGILVVGLGTLAWLKGSGVGDKYIQQDEPDQELAFQRAFTMELTLAAAMMVLAAVLVPVLAVVYGQPRLIAPGILAVLLLIPASALEMPLWVYYRRMAFVRQRVLEAVDPIVGFVVTVALAIAGAGYWSLVLGVIAGAIAGAVVAVYTVPYRLALRLDRDALSAYASFSWPLFIAGAGGLIVAQSSLLVGNAVLGLGAVGVISLASSITGYTDQLDGLITTTIYPALCAVKERTDLLFESFVKSNRLALMWGLPFGVGLALFASDLVRFGIGHRWSAAVGLIQVFGLVAASHQVGFNWTAFYRARDNTRPIALVSALVTVVFLALVIPLTSSDGLDGFALAMALSTAVGLVARSYYLVRLFPAFGMIRHALRAVLPTVPAGLIVLGMRALESGSRSLALALGELAVYGAVTLLATWAFERPLLLEIAGYVRPRGA